MQFASKQCHVVGYMSISEIKAAYKLKFGECAPVDAAAWEKKQEAVTREKARGDMAKQAVAEEKEKKKAAVEKERKKQEEQDSQGGKDDNSDEDDSSSSSSEEDK